MNKSLDFDSIWPHVTCSIYFQTSFTVKYFCVFFGKKLENDQTNPLVYFLVTCEESTEITSLNPDRS